MTGAQRLSGLAWAPTIPAHWGSARLGQLARLESGHTPSRQHPEYWVPEECTIPWFSLADVWQLRDGRQEYLGETAERISPMGLRHSSARLLPTGTVVLSRTASVGFSGIMPRPMATTQDFANWVCGPKLLPEYLLWSLRGMHTEFDRLTMGSTHQTIYMPDIRKLAVPVPPIREQRAIVADLRRRLSGVDGLIAKKERLIELLEEQRDAAIAAAVTVGAQPQARFSPTRDTWFRSIPAHWRMSRIGWLARVGNGSTPNREEGAYWAEDGVPWLNSGRVGDDEAGPADRFVTTAALRECHLPVVRPGSVLVAITGEGQTRGRVSMLRQSSTVSQHIAYIAIQDESMTPEFLLRQLQARYEWLRAESAGGGSTKAALTCGDLRRLPVVIPGVEEQRAICTTLGEKLTGIKNAARIAERQVILLREYRRALVTAAVTGQFALRASPAAAASDALAAAAE